MTLLGVLVVVGLASGCRRSQSQFKVEEVEPLPAEPQPVAAPPQEPMTIAPIESVTLRPGENVSRKVQVDRKGR
ncbi:hypothetical protein, partial [Thermogutta sp.]|uniref:hypothetical protein n=1 Tax=Thermogutta sp. TaxID=1962930 RepID=UPI0025F8C36A